MNSVALPTWCSMSSLRVLSVIETLGRGGAEQVLVNGLPALQKRGHPCAVAVLRPPYTLAPDLEAAGIPVHALNLNHRWNLPQGVSRLVRVAGRFRATIIHGHLFFGGVYTALTRGLLPSARRAVTFHNLGYDSYPANTTWRKVRKRIDAHLMRHGIDGLVAPSRPVARHYEDHLRLPPVEVIPNPLCLDGVDVAPAPSKAKVLASIGVSGDAFTVIFPGRLVPEKGHRFFLQALALLHARRIRLRAIIIGDGPLQAELAAEVKSQDLEEMVSLHPAVPHAQLLALVAAADILVMASTHEGFGLAAAEAMALGKAVVATRVGGIPELIEDGKTGLLVPPADPHALAERIAQVRADEALRERLGQEGRRRTSEELSADILALRWETYYRNLFGPSFGAKTDPVPRLRGMFGSTGCPADASTKPGPCSI